MLITDQATQATAETGSIAGENKVERTQETPVSPEANLVLSNVDHVPVKRYKNICFEEPEVATQIIALPGEK